MLSRLFGLALLALALPLASCAAIKTVAGLTVSQKYVAVAVQGYDAVEVSATQYLRLPTCAAGQSTLSTACKKPVVIPVLIKDVRAGRAARDSLWASSKANPDGVGAIDLYNAVIAATTTINSDLAK